MTTKDEQMLRDKQQLCKNAGKHIDDILYYETKIKKLEAEIKELEEGATQQNEVYESEIANLEAENEKLKEDNDRFVQCCDCKRVFYDKPCPDCINKRIEYFEKKLLATLKENVDDLKNPYPEDVFISVKGKASRVAYDCCKEDVVKLIEAMK